MIEDKIKEIIEKMRPYLNMDGGDIEYIKYEDNYIYVRMTGACSNCMFQENTVNEGLLQMFQSEIPEIKGIINVDL